MHLRSLVLTLSAAFAPAVCAADLETIRQQQNILERQQQQQLREQMQPDTDVRLPAPQGVSNLQPTTAADEADGICFPIQRIDLVGEAARRFDFALQSALKRSQFAAGQCLDAQDINRIMTLAQNAVIGRGYTTTRIMAAPQDLRSGVLALTVLPGRIREVRVDVSDAARTHADRAAAFQNEFPVSSGKILNLRDLEQGLENLKRLPTVETDIQIVPTKQPQESVVAVRWRQRLLPYRLSLGVDDSGSKATGKWQGNVIASADNPLGLSDMAYLSFGRSLGNVPDADDGEGRKVKGRTRNFAAHYSVPFGKWLWSFNHSRYRYHQAVAGYNEVYDYNGDSTNTDLGVSRLLYRDAKRKTHLGAKLWQRQTRSHIDDAEVAVQRRKTAGWQVDVSHKEYLGRATAALKLAYKRGTGMNGALPAPEAAFGEGTSRMKVLTAAADLNLPFAIGQRAFSYDLAVHAQWNKTPLIPQDKIAIGGRYTVRGFDGELSLAAERGWYARNELAWHYRPAHQLYAAVDVGRVSGRSAKELLGRGLAGAAVGVRGQFKAGGALTYDLFAAKPLKKPDGFQTKRIVSGLSLNYSF